MHKFLLPVALLIALLTRLTYVICLDSGNIWTPWSTVKDAYVYNNSALSLIQHGVYGYAGRPSAFHPPLYGFFIAGTYLIFGLNNFLALRILQALMGVGTVFIIYQIAKTIYGKDTGLIAAYVSAVYPLSLYFVGEILTETLFIFLLSLSLLRLLKLREKPTSLNFLLCGALFSLTILCRPVVAFIPIAIVWLCIACKSRMMALKLSLFVVGLMVCVVPWSIRNYLVFHAFIPLPTTGGYTLALGATTLPYTEAMAKVKDALGYDQWDIKDPDFTEFIDEGKFDKEAKALARKMIFENPTGYLAYVTRNFLHFFFNVDFSAIKARSFSGVVSLISLLSYVVVAISALLAVFVSIRKRILSGPILLVSFILSSALFHSLFLVGIRYRFATADNYLIVLSSYLYFVLLSSARASRGKKRPEHHWPILARRL